MGLDGPSLRGGSIVGTRAPDGETHSALLVCRQATVLAAELRATLRSFPGPALLLRGGNSEILSPEAAEDTVAALNNATLVTVPNTGHNNPSDDSRSFRREVRAWLGLEP